MRKVIFIAALAVHGAPAEAQTVTNPDSIAMIVDDVRRLARVIPLLPSSADTAATLQQHYLDSASSGLKAYAQRTGLTAQKLAQAIAKNPAAYANLHALADTILQRRGELVAAARKLRELLPGASLPTFWFVAGAMGPGGLTGPGGVYVAAERFHAVPDHFVPIAMHEAAHFQQVWLQGPATYRKLYSNQTLLGLAIREGAADLVAQLTTGSHINRAAEIYGLPREAELWQRFQGDMHNADPAEWMFARPRAPGVPQDLGYWMGYRITQRYYERSADKRMALKEILAVTDFPAFLAASGYDGVPTIR